MWQPGLDLLAERFKVYLPEHPGFGSSERPSWLGSIHDLALYYLDLIADLGGEPIHLVGHSLGGWIAADLASQCADRIARLVLLSAPGLTVRDEDRADVFMLRREELVRRSYYDPALCERILSRPVEGTALEAQIRNWATMARLAWRPFMSDPTLAARLRRVRVPTLIAWGAQDRIVPPHHAQAYAAAIPDAHVSLIDACGHAPALERPAEFARLIGEFLSAAS